MSTDEQHAAAILTAINATLAALPSAPSTLRAYEYDDLPATRPENYIEVGVSRRFGGESRESGHKTTTGWRVTTRGVGRSVKNARDLLQHGRTSLEFKSLTVNGEKTSLIQFETEDAVSPDEGYYSGLSSYTYVIKE